MKMIKILCMLAFKHHAAYRFDSIHDNNDGDGDNGGSNSINILLLQTREKICLHIHFLVLLLLWKLHDFPCWAFFAFHHRYMQYIQIKYCMCECIRACVCVCVCFFGRYSVENGCACFFIAIL